MSHGPHAPKRSLQEIVASMHASSERTPSTVVDAFVPGAVRAAGCTLPPLTTETWLFLEKIKSPFAQNNPGVEISFQQMLEAFYIIVTDPDRIKRELALAPESDGSFPKAVEAFARSIPLRELPAIGVALAAHIEAEFAPHAETGPADKSAEGGDSPLAPSLSAATAPAAS